MNFSSVYIVFQVPELRSKKTLQLSNYVDILPYKTEKYKLFA